MFNADERILLAVIAVAIGAVAIGIGLLSRYGLGIENIDPVLIYYGVVGDVFPFALVVVMIVVLLAAVISSADSFLLAGSSSVVNDLIRPLVTDQNDKKMLVWSRMSFLIVSVVALVLALSIPGIVNLMVTGMAMTVSGLLAPIMLGLFWKRVTKSAGLAPMWGGLVTAVTWQILGHPFGLHPIFVGLPLSLVTLLVVTALTKQREPVTTQLNIMTLIWTGRMRSVFFYPFTVVNRHPADHHFINEAKCPCRGVD